MEPETIKIWKELLIDLDYRYYQKAIVKICKDTVDIYPGTNIPALIRKTAGEFKSEAYRLDRQDAERKKIEGWKREEKASPEEIKRLIGGMNLKSIPG